MTGVVQKSTLQYVTDPVVKTVAEAAERLGVTRQTIYDWAADGTLPAIRKAPHLFSEETVEARAEEMVIELRAKLAHLLGEEVAA